MAPGNIPPSSLQPRVIQGPAAERLANPCGHREQESRGLPDPFLLTGNTGFRSTVASDPERKLILPGQEAAPGSCPSRQCWCPRALSVGTLLHLAARPFWLLSAWWGSLPAAPALSGADLAGSLGAGSECLLSPCQPHFNHHTAGPTKPS